MAAIGDSLSVDGDTCILKSAAYYNITFVSYGPPDQSLDAFLSAVSQARSLGINNIYTKLDTYWNRQIATSQEVRV
jgi:hypothetical protein